MGLRFEMGLKIAIGGKGGVGKTTVCAVWARLFAEDGFDVLAIDADPNTNLALAFGLPSEQNPEPLVKMKDLIAERTGTGGELVAAYFRLNPKVSDLPEKYWLAADGVKLLVLGGITTILQREEMVLVDLAAGVEFLGRASIQGIDALVMVVEPGARSIETANNIARMGEQLGVKFVGALANKITDARQAETIKSQLTMPVLGNIDYSPGVQEADLRRVSVFESGGEIVNQLREAKRSLEKELSV
ncbi:MAG: ATP-binding protein [Planctomycetota bacterium]